MKKDFSTVSQLLRKATEIWGDFYESHKQDLKGKKSLYFFAQDHYGSSGGIILGSMTDGELATAMVNSTEKLSRTLTGDPFFSTSFPTQNYAEKKYGGCVRTSLARVTSSGLSPKPEHMFGVRVLKECGYLGDIEYKNIQAEFEKYKDFGK